MNAPQASYRSGNELSFQSFTALHPIGLDINLIIIFSLQQYELEPVLHSDGLFPLPHDGQNP